PEIWATGLRNPWRYSFDRETGEMFIADVGQNRAEEIDVQSAASRGGENYGWRSMEGLECYPANSACSRDGLTLPVHEYARAAGFSITGGFVYRGNRRPGLRGIYIYSDYVSGSIWGLQREGANWVNQLLLASPRNGISSFGEDETGEIYAVGHAQGELYLVTSGRPVTTTGAVVNAASFSPGIVAGHWRACSGPG
ncbi:MAG: PQQ-dependent sugar dehydrogenase, partial [Bryobacteraceae bacterium]